MTRPSQAVAAARTAPPRSLDYWPTPPWATRALFHHVIGTDWRGSTCWEPACGDGHMAEPLRQFFGEVQVSDVFAYPYVAQRGGVFDFLDDRAAPPVSPDFIVTNPPFIVGDRFVLRALALAEVGIAIFHRLQWLEGGDRYDTVFRRHPPSVTAIFAGRVNIVPGRLDPKGSSARAYAWSVWFPKSSDPGHPLTWIPPTARLDLEQPDDYPAWPLSPEETPLLCTTNGGA